MACLFILVKGCDFLLLKDALKTDQEVSKLDVNTYSKVVPYDYLDLFANKKDLVLDSSLTSQHRSLVTELHNGPFYMQVYKLDSLDQLSIGKIYEDYNSSEVSKYTYYVDASTNKRVRIQYKLGIDGKMSSIFFSLNGDHTQVLKKNDSIAYYYSNFKSFSIKYQEQGKIDILGKARTVGTNAGNLPIEIMFLKRKTNLYFILLAAPDSSTSLGTDILYNLIIK